MKQTNDEILIKAFGEYNKILSKALSQKYKNEKIATSPKFEKRMEKLIKNHKKFYYPLINTLAKRIACFALMILLAATTITFSIEAAREPILSFLIEKYREFTIFSPVEPENTAPTEFTELLPTYFPEGYERDSFVKSHSYIECIMKNQAGTTISFTQYDKFNAQEMNMYLNTEHSDYKQITINNKYEGIYLEHNSNKLIVFSTDQYIFEISSSITENELLKIAESIEIPS